MGHHPNPLFVGVPAVCRSPWSTGGCADACGSARRRALPPLTRRAVMVELYAGASSSIDRIWWLS